jgi:multiple sugar transport system substrate-binding protein
VLTLDFPDRPKMRLLDRVAAATAVLVLIGLALLAQWRAPASFEPKQAAEEVVFWHFWGGEDRRVVEEVVARFNAAQTRYRVRGVAMPGNNLDLKVFLAITGGDPPDLINQDDPILGDWAARGALLPLEEIVPPDELQELDRWLFPAARRLGIYDGRHYALCNGLDIRALYYNQTLLEELNESPPTTLAELDALAERITPPGVQRRERYAFLPDARRLWAWGPVFGGGFFADEEGHVAIDTPSNRAALEWMIAYRRRYGSDNLAAFRTGDQSLPGKTFPLLSGRYVFLMDGQWRVRDIRAAQRVQRERGETPTQYGVCPLPPPQGGRRDAGWVNGNFFVVPRGAKRPNGAWEFMKFWSGFGGHKSDAAQTCIAGGWIPVSSHVVQQPSFQEYLAAEPLFAEFVRLAGSEHQYPVPIIPGAPLLKREIESLGEHALSDENADDAAQLLAEAERNVNAHLARQAGAQR